MQKIPVEISARHIHLSKEDLDILFGDDFKLNVEKKLSQPGMFAAQETVTIIYGNKKEATRGVGLVSRGSEKELKNVRIVGPLRDRTQLEISFSEAVRIGAKPDIRISGDIQGTPGFKIIGPLGEVTKQEGMIVSQRHLHVTPEDLKKFSLKDGDEICIKTGDGGKRRVTFYNVKIRVSPNFKLSFHIDTDEGNAAGMLGWCGYGEISE